MPSSTEFHAPATPDTTKAASVLVLPAQKELPGTELNVQLLHAPTDISSTVFPASASPRVPHAVRTPTGTEQCVSAHQDSTK